MSEASGRGGESDAGGWASLRRLRFRSLAGRIIALVFSAALVTGVAVSLISTSSTERFLRKEIDERFPALLEATARALDQWYTQREEDITTFAASETVVHSLSASPDRSRSEARRYLAYVQEGFPQYHSLFVLDTEGRVRVSVGEMLRFPEPLHAQLAAVDATVASAVLGGQEKRFQVISAPIQRDGRRLGTLHALILTDSIEELMARAQVEPGTGLYVIGPEATVLARSPGARDRRLFELALPEPGRVPRLQDYRTLRGDHVVGSVVRFERFDWTLAIEQEYDVAFAPIVTVIRQVFAINIGIVVAFGLGALVIARSIVRPIWALSEGARRIAAGDTDVDIPQAPGQDEIGVLSRALHEMVERLRSNQIELERRGEQIERANADLTRANQDLHRNNEMLEQLSNTDSLTRLHNHRFFQDRLRVEVRRCDRTGEPLSLLLVDIDDFKALNDRYGHAAGDQVLAGVAAILNGAVREADLPARYGGEEFAVLAPRSGVEEAAALAEQLRMSVAEASFAGVDAAEAESVRVTVSIGVAEYAGDALRLFNEADRALYRAKGTGKDCVVRFEEGWD